MKTLKHYSKLLLATCTLLLAPAMVLAGQGNWNIVDGGKIVNGKYQLKCGEGSGWQKCGGQENIVGYAMVTDHFAGAGQTAKNFDVYWTISIADEDLNSTQILQNAKRTNYLPPGFKKRKYSYGGMSDIRSYFYGADYSYYIKPIVVDGEEWFIDPQLPANKNFVPHEPEGLFSVHIFIATKK